MEPNEKHMKRRGKIKWRLEDGRMYFSRAAERKFFFGLTMFMLLLGVLFKLGVFQ